MLNLPTHCIQLFKLLSCLRGLHGIATWNLGLLSAVIQHRTRSTTVELSNYFFHTHQTMSALIWLVIEYLFAKRCFQCSGKQKQHDCLLVSVLLVLSCSGYTDGKIQQSHRGQNVESVISLEWDSAADHGSGGTKVRVMQKLSVDGVYAKIGSNREGRGTIYKVNRTMKNVPYETDETHWKGCPRCRYLGFNNNDKISYHRG